MTLYSSPPQARQWSDDKPTLLISWWISLLCAFIIVLRLLGRYIRVETLFREDNVAAITLIPLFLRMGFVHPILLYGTNNILVDGGLRLTETEIRHRTIASGLVLASRVLHPAILWLLKGVTLEFFERLVGMTGKNRYTLLLRFMRISLVVSFLATIIADLAECQPFKHYWQVIPDPGPQCRQGYAQLLTVTVCNVFTDLLLVVFPVPIVVQSRLSMGRKTMLVILFCLHLFTVLVAIYKVPEILKEGGYQTTRTMWASAEILMATFAANALTIGTFVRDTGVKKKRFHYQPTESELRSSARRDSKVTTKKLSWNDPDSDGEAEPVKRARKTGARGSREGAALKHPVGGAPEEGVLPRTESLDSLIPRSRFNTSTLDAGGRVLKTTTIEVTVTSANNSDYGDAAGAADELLLRPLGGVVTANASSRVQGSGVVLQHLKGLPDADRDQGGSRVDA